MKKGPKGMKSRSHRRKSNCGPQDGEEVCWSISPAGLREFTIWSTRERKHQRGFVSQNLTVTLPEGLWNESTGRGYTVDICEKPMARLLEGTVHNEKYLLLTTLCCKSPPKSAHKNLKESHVLLQCPFSTLY